MKKLMIAIAVMAGSAALSASELETMKAGSELEAIGAGTLRQIEIGGIPAPMPEKGAQEGLAGNQTPKAAAAPDELKNITCSNELLSEDAAEYARRLSGHKLGFGFTDGSIYQMSFKLNTFGIVTASYTDMDGREVYRDMALHKCVDKRGSFKYIEAYKDKVSEVGTYKYEVHILIPADPGLLEGKTLRSFADLRWGNWRPALITAK